MVKNIHLNLIQFLILLFRRYYFLNHIFSTLKTNFIQNNHVFLTWMENRLFTMTCCDRANPPIEEHDPIGGIMVICLQLEVD